MIILTWHLNVLTTEVARVMNIKPVGPGSSFNGVLWGEDHSMDATSVILGGAASKGESPVFHKHCRSRVVETSEYLHLCLRVKPLNGGDWTA